MLFLSIFLGVASSYTGSISPSMLNITATKISIERNKQTAIQFSIGVSIVVLLQAFFALLFLKIIHNNPIILESIELTAIVVFTILSIVFFKKATQEQKEIPSKNSTKNGLITGLGLSFINMFSIPFYCGVAALFEMYGWLELDTYSILYFSIGSAIGTYLILLTYITLAEKVKPKIAKFSKYLNYILSAITGLVALISLIKML